MPSTFVPVKEEDLVALLIYAMRYAKDRKTYAPDDLVHMVREIFPSLSAKDSKDKILEQVQELIGPNVDGFTHHMAVEPEIWESLMVEIKP